MPLDLLLQIDQHAMEKLASIDTDLIKAEIDFLHILCAFADKADLDRRIVLESVVRSLKEMWSEIIMAL